MKVTILNEAGYDEAMLGLSLSYDQPVENMPAAALKLLPLGGSHIKFLESIVVWLDITAPRYWWQQFDTYRVGVTKQSGSTMHTILKRPLEQTDFDRLVPLQTLNRLNGLIEDKLFDQLKAELPEGFLQRRIVCINYRTLRHIMEQRRNHRLEGWCLFIQSIKEQAQHPEFLM